MRPFFDRPNLIDARDDPPLSNAHVSSLDFGVRADGAGLAGVFAD